MVHTKETVTCSLLCSRWIVAHTTKLVKKVCIQVGTHIKAVILKSMEALDGTRVVFATNALGMGMNFAGVNTVIHYGAPHSLDDYLQESGRDGRTGEKATSTIYWCASDAKKYRGKKTSAWKRR